MVDTRSQALKKGKPLNPVKVVESELATKEEIMQAQALDPTLKNVRMWAEKKNVFVLTKGGESKFVVDNKLIFREFWSPQIEHGRVSTNKWCQKSLDIRFCG